MHLALIKYSVLRLALFVASLALLWLVGVRQSLMMLILAAGISLALSYVLLRRQRADLAVAIAERAGRRLPPEPGQDEHVEDAADEARRTGS